MPTVESRVVVVTGGNGGIGYGIAKGFIGQKAQVVILGRNEPTLAAASNRLGGGTIWLRVDVSKREEVRSAVDAIVRQFHSIDVLVNAAGIMRPITTDEDLQQAEVLWDDVLDTNLKGSFLMSVAIARYLRHPGGRIINISSIGSFTGGSRGGGLAYASSKAGLNGLTYALARELSPQGITVNAIAPGFIKETGFPGSQSQEAAERVALQVPVGRAGEVEDVTEATLFLASQNASYITGEVLNVNGGWLFGR
jgi:3-oxoacyl-[acyl-carrier protein] reductase